MPSRKALARAGLSLSDIDVIEISEAFAAQVRACLRGLELPFDDSRGRLRLVPDLVG